MSIVGPREALRKRFDQLELTGEILDAAKETGDPDDVHEARALWTEAQANLVRTARKLVDAAHPENVQAAMGLLSLKLICGAVKTENNMLRLYTNAVTPQPDSTAATFVEAAGAGYAPIELDGERWIFDTDPRGESSARFEARYPAQIFKFTANIGLVFGMFITRKRTGDLVFAERFHTGPYVCYEGDEILLQPTFTEGK